MPDHRPDDLTAIQRMLADAGQPDIHTDTIAAWLNARPSQHETVSAEYPLDDTRNRLVRRNFTCWLLYITERDYYQQVAMNPRFLADDVAAAQQQLLNGDRTTPKGDNPHINPDRCAAAAVVLADQGRPGIDPRIIDQAFRDNPPLYVDAVGEGWTDDICGRLYRAVTRLLLGLGDNLHAGRVRDNPNLLHADLLAAQQAWLGDRLSGQRPVPNGA